MSRIKDLAARPKLFWGLGVAFVAVLVLGVTGIMVLVGGSDDDSVRSDEAIEADASTGDDEAESSDGTGADETTDGDGPDSGGSEEPDSDENPDTDGQDDPAGSSSDDHETTGDGDGTSGNPPSGSTDEPGSDDGDVAEKPGRADLLTSEEICSRADAGAVSAATGLDIVRTDPAEGDKTPQCRYYFAGADEILTNATISVLRPEEDMEGLSGSAAYEYAVTLNRDAAAGSGMNVVETDLGVGDESILFENELLRYGIIRYGERIVTVILTAPSADHATAMKLGSATNALSTP